MHLAARGGHADFVKLLASQKGIAQTFGWPNAHGLTPSMCRAVVQTPGVKSGRVLEAHCRCPSSARRRRRTALPRCSDGMTSMKVEQSPCWNFVAWYVVWGSSYQRTMEKILHDATGTGTRVSRWKSFGMYPFTLGDVAGIKVSLNSDLPRNKLGAGSSSARDQKPESR